MFRNVLLELRFEGKEGSFALKAPVCGFVED